MMRPGDDAERGDRAEQRSAAASPRRSDASAAADVVADRRAEEPDAHHQPADARRRQLGHRAQADRAEAELAEGVQQVGDDQPVRADQHAAVRGDGAASISTTKPAPTTISPMANLVGLDGCRGPSRSQSQANTGANVMMNSALTDWNQLLGNSKPKSDVAACRDRRTG